MEKKHHRRKGEGGGSERGKTNSDKHNGGTTDMMGDLKIGGKC